MMTPTDPKDPTPIATIEPHETDPHASAGRKSAARKRIVNAIPPAAAPAGAGHGGPSFGPLGSQPPRSAYYRFELANHQLAAKRTDALVALAAAKKSGAGGDDEDGEEVETLTDREFSLIADVVAVAASVVMDKKDVTLESFRRKLRDEGAGIIKKTRERLGQAKLKAALDCFEQAVDSDFSDLDEEWDVYDEINDRAARLLEAMNKIAASDLEGPADDWPPPAVKRTKAAGRPKPSPPTKTGSHR